MAAWSSRSLIDHRRMVVAGSTVLVFGLGRRKKIYEEQRVEKSPQLLLDELLAASRLYRSGPEFKELLQFVVRMRDFAPFNAMLLQIQKPGLSFAATRIDWAERFGRTVKPGARPLLILWPFSPVALVFDVVDTAGPALPPDVFGFRAAGEWSESKLQEIFRGLRGPHIEVVRGDWGADFAGSIGVVADNGKSKPRSYQLKVNKNHTPAVQFGTIAHELAHMCLGHLGADKNLSIGDSGELSEAMREIEAEAVSYVLCYRWGIKPASEAYLSRYFTGRGWQPELDTYRIMRATGQVEQMMGLQPHITVTRTRRKRG